MNQFFPDQVQFSLRYVFPLKKISKQKLKFRNKPWIATKIKI